MKNNQLVLFLMSFIMFGFLTIPAYAQDETSSSGGDTTTPETTEVLSPEQQLDQLLQDLDDFQKELRHKRGKPNHLIGIKIKLISRKIDRAVKSTPPTKCLGKVKIAMDDFFKLVSELGTGIACGPPILPPFLRTLYAQVAPDCILPDQLSENFSMSYGIYTKARDLFHIDKNSNEIPDVCEGDISN